ncbi:MAG: ATP-binding cassette domain-containing protein [Gammaproteobacteria bacterium]|nr:ATP-binding cassette domain-containing protein [Gammaproteobacteria bacterium]
MALLEVKNLNVRFSTPDGEVAAVNDMSFSMEAGETLGIVGESGSGKSQTVLAMLQLLADNGTASGEVNFRGTELLGLSRNEINQVRGNQIAMIFQDPMTCLNPYLTVERQMREVLELHKDMKRDEARATAIAMLNSVKIPDAERRIDMYPHEFSGGMRQRVMIAMALLCNPQLLIADEPTTALDVTVQAQIIRLMNELREQIDTSIILITHDLGVVAGLCDRVAVMYAGRIVEFGTLDEIFYDPHHPYTRGLLRSIPRLDQAGATELETIPGDPPNLQHLPPGCAFQDRCTQAFDRCLTERPQLRDFAEGRRSACHLEIVA